MASSLATAALRSFQADSWPAVEHLVAAAARRPPARRRTVEMFRFRSARREAVPVPPGAFLLRTSVEYANPQLTLEEVQGILLARLLEVSARFAREHPGGPPGPADLEELVGWLGQPSTAEILPFVLNVDDIEPDRYSVNPWRASLVSSGQSARAVADVDPARLEVDPAFVAKYRGRLITDAELSLIEEERTAPGAGSYLDVVDRVKYRQLDAVGTALGIDLAIPAFRLPLTALREESPQGTLHRLIGACHRDVPTLRWLYGLFGREFGRRKTLLPAVPHGPAQEASKRLARGKVVVDGNRIDRVEGTYRTGPLYPNEVDPDDTAQGVADASFVVPADRLARFDYARTPASPQFGLYMLVSPEDGALWHGVGQFAGVQIVESYAAAHRAVDPTSGFLDVPVDAPPDPPHWDLVAEGMLRHPRWGNIDASVGSVEDLVGALVRHTRLRPLAVGARGAAAPESEPG